MQKLIEQQKSVIPACDVAELEKLEELATATADVPGIGALKVGLELVIPFGLKQVVQTVRKHSQMPIIYDHQKGGTDIPVPSASRGNTRGREFHPLRPGFYLSRW